jgi:hypothetical protein
MVIWEPVGEDCSFALVRPVSGEQEGSQENMRTIKFMVVAMLLILASATGSVAQEPGWPRQRSENGNILITYQPQVDAWKDFRELDWRMAVSLTPAGGKPAVGVVELHGQTTVDDENKMVLIDNLKIRKTHFPSLDPATATQMDQLLIAFLPPTVTISLHQLVACTPKPESFPGVELKNNPPAIFISYKPAILLDVDGPPVRARIEKTGLEYVINTHWPLFFETSTSVYYLLAGEQWLQATDLQGPWSVVKKLPKEMKDVPKDARWTNLKQFIPASTKSGADVPTVFYSTSPAEIIYINGKPAYANIPGTRLQYVTNTTTYLYFHTPTKLYYYLTAGRWFRAESLAGPWIFATPNLPADFAQIPATSPAAQVRASVPGTEESKDAVLLTQIPTTATVNPEAAAKAAKATYDGPPQFVPIEGTTLYYAKNTSQKVIKVGDLYYLCLQGVWFVSANPQGPWQTAQSVPQVIYTIPPSSPVYNVTYVTQTVYPDGTVQASYTSGYTGVYVMSVSSVVVVTGGTGYYYPPYVVPYPVYGYPIYYPPPYTYGYVAHYHSATGAYGISQTAYGPYGSATRTASYNPYTGTYARTASVSSAYGSAAVGQAYNPYTGAYGATKQGSNAYGSWGSSVVTKGGQTAYTQHQTTAQGTVGSVQTSSGGKAVGKSSASGNTAVGKTGSGDVYAGKDGNAYKKTDSGWQKYDNGSWASVQPPSSATPKQQPKAQTQNMQQTQSGQQARQQGTASMSQGGGEQMQGLQKEAQNRQRGAQSSQRSQEMQRSGSEGGGLRSRGSGSGGGGRGRR